MLFQPRLFLGSRLSRTFCSAFYYLLTFERVFIIIDLLNYGGAPMKRNDKFGLIIAIVATAATIAAAVATAIVYFEKKRKDDEDLDHYLDCSIQ